MPRNRPYRYESPEHKRRHDLKRRKKPKKAFLFIVPNPIVCMHGGAMPAGALCYSSDRNKVHVDCWRRHFNVHDHEGD